MKALEQWWANVEKVFTSEDHSRAINLTKVMEKKAEKMELTNARERKTSWKQALTRKNATRKPPHGHSLSKHAFQWVEGAAGWVTNSMAKASGNHAAPDADPGDRPFDDDGKAPTEITSSDARLEPRADQAEVEEKANTWAKLWDELAQYDTPDFTAEEQLPPLTVAALRSFGGVLP